NRLVRKRNRYDLPGRQLSAIGEIKVRADLLEEIYRKGGTSPPTIEEAIRSEKNLSEAIEYLFGTGRLVRVGGALAFHRDVWRDIITKLVALLADGRMMAVGEFREAINSSRKYVVPILEETDRLKITQRQGDFRVPGENYEKAQTLL
ncbi:MAG: SelB C-terminal domain-containing protein, partial [bacterium]